MPPVLFKKVKLSAANATVALFGKPYTGTAILETLFSGAARLLAEQGGEWTLRDVSPFGLSLEVSGAPGEKPVLLALPWHSVYSLVFTRQETAAAHTDATETLLGAMAELVAQNAALVGLATPAPPARSRAPVRAKKGEA